MGLPSPINNENVDFVMPARIADIQIRKDASENIRVNLDSSTPCWNGAIERALLELPDVLPPSILKGVFHHLTLAHRE